MGQVFESLPVLFICVLYVVFSLSDNVLAKKLDVVLYYETHCPFCIKFFRDQLEPTVQEYSSHFNLLLKPYGNAETYKENGEQKVACQHGEIECYCNKMHACAIDEIKNNTKAAFFTTCLMTDSDEKSEVNDLLTTCGTKFNVSSAVIKECVNSDRGFQLLLNHGRETKRNHVRGVPYVTYNGVLHRGKFAENLCYYEESDKNSTRRISDFCFKIV